MSEIIIGFKAPTQLRDRLKEHTNRLGMKHGHWLRKAVEDALAREQTPKQEKTKNAKN